MERVLWGEGKCGREVMKTHPSQDRKQDKTAQGTRKGTPPWADQLGIANT